MSKKGFLIKINDENPVKAGFDNDLYSVTCILSAIEREIEPRKIIDINVSGLVSDKKHVRWLRKSLAVGDKISIEVVSGRFDPPEEVVRENTEELLLESKLKAYHALKKELKDHIMD